MPADLLHRLGEQWRHLPLRSLGVLSAALPMVAVVVSAVLAFLGNENRQRLEMAITRHFEMVVRTDALLTLLLNAETGLRGHVLTQRQEFLEPFDLAARSLPGELRTLHAFVEAEPGDQPRAEKLARLNEIETTTRQEMDLLTRLRDAPAPSPGTAAGEFTGQFIHSKELMDSLRTRLREMQADEKRLLGLRLDEIRQVRQRDYLSISVALCLGLVTRGVVFWLFNRRVTRRVEQLTENVRALAVDEPLPHAPSGRHDAIGELEQAVADAHARPPTPHAPR